MYQKAAFKVMAKETTQEIPNESGQDGKDSEEYLFRFFICSLLSKLALNRVDYK